MIGYEALHRSAAYVDYSDRGKILVTGEDRARLLHAMSTNDIAGLAPDAARYALFLNAQGRILGDAWILNLGDKLLLDTEPELRQKLQEHLDKYIIADDVYLEDVTQQWAEIGIEGPDSLALAQRLGFIQAPPQVSSDSVHLAHTSWGHAATPLSGTGSQGVRCFVSTEHKEQLLSKLRAAGVPEASSDEARVVRIENGVARYGEEITERFLVQEAGVMKGVHPNKGCYLGQEIVERVRSRAQVHRHLSSIEITGEAVPAAGTRIQSDGKDVAEIVSAVYSPQSKAVRALAYVRTEALANLQEMLTAGSGARAVVINNSPA
jgi:aminomethyltransferase